MVRSFFAYVQPGPELEAMTATIKSANPMLRTLENIGIKDLPTESGTK